MTDAGLTISFAGDKAATATTAKRFVHLEQIKVDQSKKTVTMFDLQQMVARAKAGVSARTYKPPDCPAYIEGNSIFSWFDFYAWPSSITLPHTITSSLGEVSRPTIIEKSVEFSITFKMSDVYEFDFILADITSYHWETACYDSLGKVIDNVELEMDGLSTLRASAVIFGVVRIRGTKKGAQHRLNVRLVKVVPVQPDGELPTVEEWDDSGADEFDDYQDWLNKYYGFTDAVTWNSRNGVETVPKDPVNMTGLSITNLQATVTAKWMDGGEEKTESLRMDIPQCLRDLLEACGAGNGNGDAEQHIFDMCGGDDEDAPWHVYVSSCSGEELLAVQQDKDNNSWCGKNG